MVFSLFSDSPIGARLAGLTHLQRVGVALALPTLRSIGSYQTPAMTNLAASMGRELYELAAHVSPMGFSGNNPALDAPTLKLYDALRKMEAYAKKR